MRHVYARGQYLAERYSLSACSWLIPQTPRDIGIMLIKCWPIVCNAGPELKQGSTSRVWRDKQAYMIEALDCDNRPSVSESSMLPIG